MSTAGSPVKVGRAPIGRRPAADPASTWVHQTELPEAPVQTSPFTARLTIDVTPALRGRIKMIAFRRGKTAADMLRALLEREYPETSA
ncbi:MAG: chromosome partitioning protein ParB [Burkholderiales bacterium]|nr:chromosome partitioning protein ParB [Burkholderiales bacterium]